MRVHEVIAPSVLFFSLAGCPALLSDYSITADGNDGAANGDAAADAGDAGTPADGSAAEGSAGDAATDVISTDALLDAGRTCATTQAPSVPNLSTDVGVGLRFRPLANVTLTQFVFHNQGHADSVVLTDAMCNVLASIAVPASTPAFTANVNWPLTAGTTYLLTSTTGTANSMWGSASFPWTSGNLVVESGGGCYDGGGNSQSYWFNFADLRGCE